MSSAKQVLQNEAQHNTNIEVPAQPNPTPPGPPPMVLQNLLPLQGLVATTPAPQPTSTTPSASLPIEIGVHYLLALTTEEVNLQTRKNQYGSNIEPTDLSLSSTSNTTNIIFHLHPFPPLPPMWWVSNNATTRAAVSYNIVDDLA